MWARWFPWRFIISKMARRHGFIDPIQIVSRINRVAQPSEVAAPVELMRLAAVLHARGLINSQIIQNNLDWIWPYWVQRQFDPKNRSFIPRAFSLTHINLTHRNWTAVGLPGLEQMPIVDPAGLVTPLFDGWSLDAWFVPEAGDPLVPSREEAPEQTLGMEKGLSVVTRSARADERLRSEVRMVEEDGKIICRINVSARSGKSGYLAVSLRPYNPEGISFVHEIRCSERKWEVNAKDSVLFSAPPERHILSNYTGGDVFSLLGAAESPTEIRCDVGLSTAAALYPVKREGERNITVEIPLKSGRSSGRTDMVVSPVKSWENTLDGAASLRVPDPEIRYLYDASLRTLALMSPGEILVGPFTYKQFWFRDAVYAMNAMLAVNLPERVSRALGRFIALQGANGYFRSQEGEWDSNGQVLWILNRFYRMTGRAPDDEWLAPAIRAVKWIRRKRVPGKKNRLCGGLFPSGFSAEHFGPNDYYYWDDFWGVAGLRSAADLMRLYGREDTRAMCEEEERSFLDAIDRSIKEVQARKNISAIPVSPNRRMDSGAAGNLVASYPLKIYGPMDERVMRTVEYLMEEDLYDGMFFHELAHSGVNIYLSLQIAQVLLRAGDRRYYGFIRGAAELASGTGQWPEAIHPWSGGGCMGDGQHLWASSEWILMLRNCFLREEDDVLVLCSGIPDEWLKPEETLFFGPSLTSFGKVSVSIEPVEGRVTVSVQAEWRDGQPDMVIRFPGRESVKIPPGEEQVTL
ncbi:MAG: hypothetical protein GF392_01510 [Candidatus Omnitrophica bacterium]|nr:hypothetical protein [Candidatus Omnitrophota bacterium]